MNRNLKKEAENEKDKSTSFQVSEQNKLGFQNSVENNQDRNLSKFSLKQSEVEKREEFPQGKSWEDKIEDVSKDNMNKDIRE